MTNSDNWIRRRARARRDRAPAVAPETTSEEPKQRGPLVTQGARGAMPPFREPRTVDDAIRDAARSTSIWTRIE